LDEKIASKVADPADDPEVVLQKKTQAELLRHALARLSPEHGEVIDLVYFHGKSVKEVAEIVGIAEATVKLADLVVGLESARCHRACERCGPHVAHRQGRRLRFRFASLMMASLPERGVLGRF
jgi:FixJ family two-component response regulator